MTMSKAQALAGMASVVLVAMGRLAVAQDDGAMTTLRRYSAAINAGDCDTVYRLTSDAVRRRDAFPGDWHQTVCALLGEWHRSGMRETLGEPKARLVDGWRRIVFVRAAREREQPPNRITTDFDYIVHSSDAGRTWRVLDLACVDARWVNEVFPSYRGDPPVHAADARVTHLAR